MRKFLMGAAIALLSAASPAAAEWRQARTDHFILNIDDSEEGARDFAVRLERFDAALRRLYDVPDNPDQHARPVTIYALKDDIFHEVCGCRGAVGVYHPRTSQSFIFSAHMPKLDRKAETGGWSSQTVLLHEYAHHFMYSNYPIAYPYWFSEGFAEFNANASFEEDGAIIIGYAANYRGQALKGGVNLSPKRLFDPHRYGFDYPDLVYGRGWLLTHYLMLHPARSGQLGAYLTEMNKGSMSLAGAERAFGDLDRLNRELDAYVKGVLRDPVRIPADTAPVKVRVTTLPEGQAKMLPVIGTVRRGIREGYRLGVAMKAGRIADDYPDDPVVQAQWAEAEFYAGRIDRAEKAADAALKLKPDQVEALTYKGLVAVRRASEGKATDPAVWADARAWYLKANRADPNAVMPLYLYYVSFLAEKKEASPGAVKGLMRSAALAPESAGVRLMLARQMLIDDDASSARQLLQPLAFTPHRVQQENKAREIVDLIDAGKVEEAKTIMVKMVEEGEEED